MYNSWDWRKASLSDLSGDQCVEISCSGLSVLVRDSKEVGRGMLSFSPASWQSFLRTAPSAPESRDARG
jgi:hypothetical protein